MKLNFSFLCETNWCYLEFIFIDFWAWPLASFIKWLGFSLSASGVFSIIFLYILFKKTLIFYTITMCFTIPLIIVHWFLFSMTTCYTYNFITLCFIIKRNVPSFFKTFSSDKSWYSYFSYEYIFLIEITSFSELLFENKNFRYNSFILLPTIKLFSSQRYLFAFVEDSHLKVWFIKILCQLCLTIGKFKTVLYCSFHPIRLGVPHSMGYIISISFSFKFSINIKEAKKIIYKFS